MLDGCRMENGAPNASFKHFQSRSNAIQVLAIRNEAGTLQTNEEAICSTITNFFQKVLASRAFHGGLEHFGKPTRFTDAAGARRWVLDCLADLISRLLKVHMDGPIHAPEIFEAVPSMPTTKTPGPDGVPFEFLLRYGAFLHWWPLTSRSFTNFRKCWWLLFLAGFCFWQNRS